MTESLINLITTFLNEDKNTSIIIFIDIKKIVITKTKIKNNRVYICVYNYKTFNINKKLEKKPFELMYTNKKLEKRIIDILPIEFGLNIVEIPHVLLSKHNNKLQSETLYEYYDDDRLCSLLLSDSDESKFILKDLLEKELL